MQATYLPQEWSNLEITIAGSCCRPQVTIKLLLAYLHINQKETF